MSIWAEWLRLICSTSSWWFRTMRSRSSAMHFISPTSVLIRSLNLWTESPVTTRSPNFRLISSISLVGTDIELIVIGIRGPSPLPNAALSPCLPGWLELFDGLNESLYNFGKKRLTYRRTTILKGLFSLGAVEDAYLNGNGRGAAGRWPIASVVRETTMFDCWTNDGRGLNGWFLIAPRPPRMPLIEAVVVRLV